MHRSGPLYPPLGIAVPALRVQVGTAKARRVHQQTPRQVLPGAESAGGSPKLAGG